jgi:flagellar motor switch protein FliN/FliY
MSNDTLTPRDALLRLGASTAEAVAQVLEMFAPGAVERGEVTVLPEGTSPFAGVPAGSVAASVSYVDGVVGANIFVLTAAGVRSLAGAMGMPAAEDGADAEPSELELSAVGEASNQMMAAAASAIGVVLGQEIEISVPDIRVMANPEEASEIYGTSPHATSTTFLVAGESCRLIQLVPSSFVARMARAFDDISAEQAAPSADDGADGALRGGVAQTMALVDALGGINLRVWAELGRTEMGLARALGLPRGSVVELDHVADAPIDLYVNGLRFAQGRLIVTDDGEWAFQCDSVGGRSATDGLVPFEATDSSPGEPTNGSAPTEAPDPTAAPEPTSALDATSVPTQEEGALN